MKSSLLITSFVLFISILTVPVQSQSGYVVAGYGYSYSNGNNDLLVYRLDASGSKLWRKNYGGQYSEYGGFIQQTADGGFILAGESDTYTHGDRDLLVYKLDAAGKKEWRKNYGGQFVDNAASIMQTADGGYILGGHGRSYTNGGYDLLVYKLSATGAKQWRRNYGGWSFDHNTEQGGHIRQTADGGYILGGTSDLYANGETDLLVYKLDATGVQQWRKNYGGLQQETGGHIRQTADGGYILGGAGDSYSHGGWDLLVYKLDASGKKVWRKNYGGGGSEIGGDIRQTADGGYILGGFGNTYSHGQSDLLVYKLDSAGTKVWRKNYGGLLTEKGGYIRQVSGGYILGGYGDTYTHGLTDFLVYKLDTTGTKVWRKNYGGIYGETLNSLGSTN
jgi:hypothetical protein